MKENDFGFLVRLIAGHIQRDVNRELEQFDLTITQGKFLGYLKDNRNRQVSQKELQNHFEITHPTTAGIVKRLEAKGMIRTRIDETDKRSKIVELAEGEEKVHQTMMLLREKTEKELFKGFSNEEKDQLIALLLRVHENTSCEKIK